MSLMQGDDSPSLFIFYRHVCRENLGLEINITMNRVAKLQNCSKRKVVTRKNERNSVIIRIRKTEELITCTM